MNAYRPALSRGVLSALAALLVLMAAASTASAVTGHRYSRTINPSGNGQLGGVAGVLARPAAGQSPADVFAVDPSAAKVQHYTQAGDYLGTIDVSGAVPNAAYVVAGVGRDEVYVGGTDSLGAGVVVRYTVSTGAAAGAFDLTQVPGGVTEISGIASDANGDLYVGDTAGKQVRVFSSDGTLTTSFDGTTNGGTAFESLGPLAVDGNQVFVDEPFSRLQRFSTTGSYQASVDVVQPFGVAVDSGNGDVFVAEVPVGGNTAGITRFANGAPQQRFAEGRTGFSAPGLSVDGTNHTVFAANTNEVGVDVYVPFTAPDVTTDPATDVGTDSATLSGRVDPLGQETTYQFEYGRDDSYSSGSTDPKTIAAGDPAELTTETIAGLRPNTTYHFRLKATNSLGSNASADRTFTTAPAPPSVTGEVASAITVEGATLSATVDPNGNDGTAHFEYGTEAGVYGTPTADFQFYGYQDPQPFSATISGLQPDTVYHYRVVADNGVGAGLQGQDQTFKTLPAQPLATAGQAVLVSGDTAQLSGTVDTQGLAGTVSFLVRATNSTYSATTAPVALPAGSGSRAVSAALGGLPAGGAFEVRVRIQTTTGTVFSEASTFATAYVPAPATPAPLVFNAFPYPPIVIPSNRFTASASVKGSTGTVKVKVPGRGLVTATGSRLSKATARPTKAGTVSLKVKLTKRGRAALRKAKSKRLRIKVAVRYRPTDGTTRTGYRTLTFRR